MTTNWRAAELEELLRLVCLRAARPEAIPLMGTMCIMTVKVPAALVEQARLTLGYKTCDHCGRWAADVQDDRFGNVLCAKHGGHLLRAAELEEQRVTHERPRKKRDAAKS